MKLKWLPVYRWPEYKVSNHGEVQRVAPGKGARIGRILRPGKLKPFGHRYVVLSARGQQKTHLVSRLMLRAFRGPAPSGKNDAAHRDGNAANDLLSNVRWASRAENEADKVVHGRSNQGVRHGMSKLTEADVRKIRGSPRAQAEELARRFGVCARYVRTIRSRQAWKHLK